MNSLNEASRESDRKGSGHNDRREYPLGDSSLVRLKDIGTSKMNFESNLDAQLDSSEKKLLSRVQKIIKFF